MDSQSPLYNAFFKAQDKFIDHYIPHGFEPDIVHEYIHSAMTLSSFYAQGTEHENALLCELYLRQVYFHLIEAVQDPCRSKAFRRVCLDSIHTPLLCLKRYYHQWEDGEIRFLQLQQRLQRIRMPLD
ncbi:hypothetical protein GCM10007938_07470 [Vibrio zhanjiangensis]|uniref:Uncharacterized protein n=1 Tax=Vibrio zhanjiangensis TaxID=1046128 RepID=A0ABQ6EWT1_9VIBR|nr:hypothetical protein [Vibrio zhanjiangensis]GLT16970.1 hypothetical protein GCM10007938_07470 [Vibrio zhanjiangensis]